jgi:MYXO-CTERM domain-containing protein
MQARSRASLLAAAIAGVALAFVRPAAANGRFPAASQLVFSPRDPSLLVLRTTFGLLITHDRGATWQWVCEAVIGLGSAQEDPCFGVTEADAIVGGLWQGLSISSDTGCNWAFAGGALAGQSITDLVVRPDDPHAVLALTGTWIPDAGPSDGAPSTSYYSQIFQSTDDAVHFAPLGLPIDSSAVVVTLEVAKSDPNRLYVSTTRGEGAGRTAQLFVSSDGGASWTERPLPLIPAIETAFYIGAVDPSDGDVVYLRSDVNSRLLVTTDAGQSFQVASFEGADGGVTTALRSYMFGFALSPDGSKIYAGDVVDGLFSGSRGNLALTHRSDVHVQCLAARDGELWACSDEASGFVMGLSTDDGATFTPKLQLDGVDGVLACSADAAATECAAEYPAQCQQLDGCSGGDAGVDGGVGEAGGHDAGDGAGGGGTRRSSCGCSVIGGAGPVGFVAFASAALALLRRRRRG